MRRCAVRLILLRLLSNRSVMGDDAVTRADLSGTFAPSQSGVTGGIWPQV
jgi:hypothetical protein